MSNARIPVWFPWLQAPPIRPELSFNCVCFRFYYAVTLSYPFTQSWMTLRNHSIIRNHLILSYFTKTSEEVLKPQIFHSRVETRCNRNVCNRVYSSMNKWILIAPLDTFFPKSGIKMLRYVTAFMLVQPQLSLNTEYVFRQTTILCIT